MSDKRLSIESSRRRSGGGDSSTAGGTTSTSSTRRSRSSRSVRSASSEKWECSLRLECLGQKYFLTSTTQSSGSVTKLQSTLSYQQFSELWRYLSRFMSVCLPFPATRKWGETGAMRVRQTQKD